MAKNKKEYELSKQVATYLRLQYPNVLFHYDLAGLNLSRTQAGMMKSIQGERGYPDLFVAHPKNGWSGLFIELKTETPLKKNGDIKTNDHLKEQLNFHSKLTRVGYKAGFGVGFSECKQIIDDYLK